MLRLYTIHSWNQVISQYWKVFKGKWRWNQMEKMHLIKQLERSNNTFIFSRYTASRQATEVARRTTSMLVPGTCQLVVLASGSDLLSRALLSAGSGSGKRWKKTVEKPGDIRIYIYKWRNGRSTVNKPFVGYFMQDSQGFEDLPTFCFRRHGKFP